ncbi:MAG: DUF6176 family protein [Actinomycetota bacterium]
MRGDLVEGTTRGSLPHGVRTELSRARIQPGMSDDADSWMQMLNDRRERMRGHVRARPHGDRDSLPRAP